MSEPNVPRDEALHGHCLRKPPREGYYDCDLAADDGGVCDEAEDVVYTVIAQTRRL
jgi:hypothetical protein